MTRRMKPYPILAPRNDSERYDLIKRTAAQLGEHFDSVVIVTTHCAIGRTARFDYGVGNAYALQASLKEVCEKLDRPPNEVNYNDEEEDDD
jgi:hypothetical protein